MESKQGKIEYDQFEVYLDGSLIGKISVTGVDQPFFLGSFAASSSFQEYKDYFVESDEHDETYGEKRHRALRRLGLEIRQVGRSVIHRDLLLHIQGDRAWFRI